MTTALQIITSAYRRLNRLSPGETLNADDAATGFAMLGELIDELGARPEALFRGVLTSAAQTGAITLGAGAWAGIAPGTKIVSATADGNAMAPITLRQLNELVPRTQTGAPTVWAQDGLSTVHLWPVPTGQTLSLQTRTTVATFSDQTTDYVLVPGWKAALSASLAVRLAPSILGNLPAELLRAESICMAGVESYEPAIVDVMSPIGGCYRWRRPVGLF